MTNALDQAKAIADAILYEGYLLYPYRASATKNRMRWQFGVLMPPALAAAGVGEHADSSTECVVERGSVLHARVRFLHLQTRSVEVPDGDGFREVPSLVVDGTEHTSWDEAVEREIDAVVPFAQLIAGVDVPLTIESYEDIEHVEGARIVRRRWALQGVLELRGQTLAGPYGAMRLTARVANTSPDPSTKREVALRRAMIAAHTLLSVDSGGFVSSLDPPEWAKPYVGACRNERSWPILVGEPGSRDTVLCSPIIIYDHPAIAEESAGNLYDGTEIDEILTLRTMTLTDDEKRAARATDERAREIIDRVDGMPQELLDRLHGTIRYLRDATAPKEPPELREITDKPDVPWWDPGADTSVNPETDSVNVGGVEIRKGSRVRLRPGQRRSDAQDMFLAGRSATVQSVFLDVDGKSYLAVTLDDDPGADLDVSHGRFRYFAPEEVEPL
jgi:hypothetical protein